MDLRVGVIGAGYFSKHYIRILQNMAGVQLAGVVVRSIADTSLVLDNIKIYTSSDEMFTDPAIDAVVIVTPPSTHMGLAVSALKHDKHVLLEKPMTTSIVDAQHIADAVKKTTCVFMVGHQYCYNDHIRELKREIEKGTLGDIKYMFAEHTYVSPIRPDVGCLWETATHELSMIDHIFPGIQARKITGQMIDMSGSGREDVTIATIAFDNDMSATIFSTWFAPQKTRRIIWGGMKGMASFDEAEEHPLVFYKHPYPVFDPFKEKEKISCFFRITEQEKYVPDIEVHEPLQNEMDHFIECIRKQQIPLTDIEHGLRITGLLDTITSHIR